MALENGFVRIRVMHMVLLSRLGGGGELKRGAYDCTRNDGEPRVYISATIEAHDTDPYFSSPYESWSPPDLPKRHR
jgi:hypothetical protein